MNNRDRFYELYNELAEVAHKIEPYYDVDKVKPYSVYIWTKGDFGDNVFDIEKDRIVYYDQNHVIPIDVMPIIEEIQAKLREIDQCCCR